MTNEIPLTEALRQHAVMAWPEPDFSLLSSELPDAPEMPALPGRWGDVVVQVAEARNCAPDYVLGSVLVGAASLIGNSRHTRVWPGSDAWIEPTILWGLLMGAPSTSKSPAADVVRDVMSRIERELAEGFETTLNDYERQKEIAKIRAEAWRDQARDAEAQGQPVPPRPMEANEPELPQRPRLVLTDSSIEQTALVAAGNPRGFMMFNDEATSKLANMERRGGSDRPFHLEMYGGRPHVVDRVKNPKPIRVDHLSVSMLATVQPDPFRELVLDSTDDGLSARFLYFFPSFHPPFRRPQNAVDFGFIERALRRLHGLQMARGEDGRLVPVIIPFTESAAEAFESWCRDLSDRTKRQQGSVQNYLGKMRGTAVRLAMVLQHLAWSQEDDETAPPSEVGASAVDAATEMIDSYILPMGFRALAGKRAPGADSDAGTIARWLSVNFAATVNAREMRRAPGFPLRDQDRIEAALVVLVDGGWLRPSQAKTGGRMRKDFSVNPAIRNAALPNVKSVKSVKSQKHQSDQSVVLLSEVLPERPGAHPLCCPHACAVC